MSKRIYPLSAATKMGASGIRCPQIIENPNDRRVPVKVYKIDRDYALSYDGSVETAFSAQGIANYEKINSRAGIATGGFIPNPEKPFLVGESGSKLFPSREVHIGFNKAKPGSDRTVIHITNAGDISGWVREVWEKHAKEAQERIAEQFKIPSHMLERDGNRFTYNRHLREPSQTPVERVYDASAWTGRKSRAPREARPDLTLAEAMDELREAIEEVFSASWILQYLRTFVALEDYIDDDNKIRTRTRFVLAVGMSSRKDIKEAIRRRNSFLRLRVRVRKMGESFRDVGAAIALSVSPIFRTLKQQLELKEAKNGKNI